MAWIPQHVVPDDRQNGDKSYKVVASTPHRIGRERSPGNGDELGYGARVDEERRDG